jgi:predicted ribosomally synthesized peptide with nif11-like leader
MTSPDHSSSVPEALRFLRQAREDPALAAQMARLAPEDGLEPVQAIAAAAGFEVSIEDLRRAHRIDWTLRRARYS